MSDDDQRAERQAMFALWRTRDIETWKLSPERYISLAKQLLRGGEPLLAFDVMNEAASLWPQDSTILTVEALTLARSGAGERANAILRDLYAQGHRDEETVSILARTHKDLGIGAQNPAQRRQHFAAAAALYAEAFAGDERERYWSGINAATLSHVLGDKDAARRYAVAVQEICRRKLAAAKPGDPDLYWLRATLGEAALALDERGEARNWYCSAALAAPKQYGDIATTRRNARLLFEFGHDAAQFLAECLPGPTIVMFTGHMMDAPDAVTPRFPAASEAAVSARIKAYLQENRAQIGFSSAACGADILFLEAMLELNGEINIVLPSTPERFIRTSVDRIPGSRWVERFEAVVSRAKQVIQVSNESVGDVFYTYVNILLCGLARLNARQIDGRLSALAVWDGAPGKLGGTGAAVRLWRECGQVVHTIHPTTFDGLDLAPTEAVAAASSTRLAADPETDPEDQRQVMSMLFSDAVGFSKLDERQIPKFAKYFLEPIGALLDRAEHGPIVRNTWGDALYFVFDEVRAAGAMALDLCDMVNGTDWSKHGLPETFGIRIGLHSGPVYPLTDPVIKQFSYTGVHVSRAARIEPITPPGTAYASREFAALAEALGVTEFSCEYVGQTAMAKHYGDFPTYRVRRTQAAKPE